MKLPRQFPQYIGTGLILLAVLLALKLTAPQETGPANRNWQNKPAATGSKSDFSHTAAGSGHENAGHAAHSPSDSLARLDSPAPLGAGEVTLLGSLHAQDAAASFTPEARPGISYRDPVITRFPELETQPLRTIDPQLAGHSVTAFGHRAAVEEISQVSGTAGVMLTLSVAPVTPAPDGNSPLSPSATTADTDTPSDTEMAAKSQAVSSWKGFTYEQELFRTKWGWQAFDQVQKVLRQQHSP